MNSDQFNMARDLSVMAADLDFQKNSFPPHHRAEAITCVREMHKLAESLAEERAGELYCNADGSDV